MKSLKFDIGSRCLFLVLFFAFSAFPKTVFSQDSNVKSGHQLGFQVNDRIVDFTLPDQDDKSQSLYGLIKGKTSIVYAYMACCYGCQQELKKLMPLFEEIKNKNIMTVGVQYRANTKYCLISSKQLNLTGTILADSKGEACAKLGVGDFTLFVVDKEGVIRYRGVFDKEKILKSLN